MSATQEWRTVFYATTLVIFLVALVMSPNLLYYDIDPNTEVWETAIQLPALLIVLLLALFGARLWLFCLLLTPFAMCAPLEDYYIFIFHRPSNASVIATIFATNSGEAIQYIGHSLWSIVGGVLASSILSIAAIRAARQSGLRISGVWRTLLVGMAVLLPVLLYLCRGSLVWERLTNQLVLQQDRSGISNVITQSLQAGYPAGVLLRFSRYISQEQAIRESRKKIATYQFGVTRTPQGTGRRIFVLVIGESSRRDRWSLFGYPRETTPQLDKQHNLIAFSDFITPWPLSIQAIPQLLTRKSTTELSDWNEPSVLWLMREAGFNTSWLSTQMQISNVDTPVSFLASQAQNERFVSLGSSGTPNGYDDLLFQPLKQTIGHSKSDLFIVLHTMGSHLAYDLRYPPSFKRFTPTLADTDTSVSEIERRNNSYDNTIAYTDYVLASFISILERTPAITALWYESDHGESLATSTCTIGGHGLGTRFDYEIPAFFWYSDAYERAYPKKVAQAKVHANARLSSADTFESLADMANIVYQGQVLSHSIFSPTWTPRQRMVNQPKLTDFDKAKFDPTCQFVDPAS